MFDEDCFPEKNPYWEHVLCKQKTYLSLIVLFVLGIPLLLRKIAGHPLLSGQETYYHLTKIPSLLQVGDVLAFLPLIVGMGSLWLYFSLARKLHLAKRFTFLLAFLIILSPSFINSFTTLSTGAGFVFLVLVAFSLLESQRIHFRYLSLIPFLGATFFDIASTITVLLLLFIRFHIKRTRYRVPSLVGVLVVGVFVLINWYFNQPLVLGPFHLQQPSIDILSDFGGMSGVSFFLIILALIGLTVTWKRKNDIFAYFFLPLLIPLYVYSTQMTLLLSIVIAFFATIGLTTLLDKNWTLTELKHVTMTVIVLGLLFSTTTYVQRGVDFQPTQETHEMMEWMKQNLPEDAKILSTPEEGYFISHFAQRTPLLRTHVEQDKNRFFAALYVEDLFPLLEENQVTHIYISKHHRASLTPDTGILFLLKNERFKLLHTREGHEVWEFT